MTILRNRVWLLPLIVGLAFPYWNPYVVDFLAVPEDKKILNSEVMKKGEQRLQMNNMLLKQTKNGKLEMIVHAEHVVGGNPDTDSYHLEGVKCQLYGENDGETIITGGEALLESTKGLITIVDEVAIIVDQGKYSIKTEALRYFLNYRMLKTATPVIYQGDIGSVVGNSMSYNLNTGDFRVTGAVVCDL